MKTARETYAFAKRKAESERYSLWQARRMRMSEPVKAYFEGTAFAFHSICLWMKGKEQDFQEWIDEEKETK